MAKQKIEPNPYAGALAEMRREKEAEQRGLEKIVQQPEPGAHRGSGWPMPKGGK